MLEFAFLYMAVGLILGSMLDNIFFLPAKKMVLAIVAYLFLWPWVLRIAVSEIRNHVDDEEYKQ